MYFRFLKTSEVPSKLSERKKKRSLCPLPFVQYSLSSKCVSPPRELVTEGGKAWPRMPPSPSKLNLSSLCLSAKVKARAHTRQRRDDKRKQNLQRVYKDLKPFDVLLRSPQKLRALKCRALTFRTDMQQDSEKGFAAYFSRTTPTRPPPRWPFGRPWSVR